MAETASDLSLFFSSKPDDPRWFEAELGAEIEAVKTALESHPGVAWSHVSEELGETIQGILKVDIADVLTAAWSKYRDLQQFRDPEKFGPEETILVPLAKHRIRSLHHPAIEIVVNDVTLGRIVFEIDLRLDLEGVLLKLRGGKIRGIKAGRCSGKGICKCGDITLMTKETPAFDLPGRVEFAAGIEIPAIGSTRH